MSEGRNTWDFPTEGVLYVRPRTSQELRNLLDRQVFVDVFHAYPSPCKPPEGTSVTENRKYFGFFFREVRLVLATIEKRGFFERVATRIAGGWPETDRSRGSVDRGSCTGMWSRPFPTVRPLFFWAGPTFSHT
jgi:hypothetical protein